MKHIPWQVIQDYLRSCAVAGPRMMPQEENIKLSVADQRTGRHKSHLFGRLKFLHSQC